MACRVGAVALVCYTLFGRTAQAQAGRVTGPPVVVDYRVRDGALYELGLDGQPKTSVCLTPCVTTLVNDGWYAVIRASVDDQRIDLSSYPNGRVLVTEKRDAGRDAIGGSLLGIGVAWAIGCFVAAAQVASQPKSSFMDLRGVEALALEAAGLVGLLGLTIPGIVLLATPHAKIIDVRAAP